MKPIQMIKKNEQLLTTLFANKNWDELYKFLLDIEVFNHLYTKDKKALVKYWRKLILINKCRYLMEEYIAPAKKIENKKDTVTFFNNLYDFYIDCIAKNERFFALEIAMINLKIAEKEYGKKTEMTALILDKAGKAYFLCYDYYNALGMYNKALAIRKQLDDKKSIAQSDKNLKSCYEKLEMYGEDYKDKFSKTPKYFLKQIKKDAEIFKMIPYEFKTPELCLAAASIVRETTINFQNFFFALDYIPYELRTKEICKIAVTSEYSNYYYVPYEHRNEEICLIFMKNAPSGFLFMPEKARTKKLCEIAIRQEPHLIRGVPKELLTKKLCEEAVKINGYVLKYIPEEFKTDELKKLAGKFCIINY